MLYGFKLQRRSRSICFYHRDKKLIKIWVKELKRSVTVQRKVNEEYVSKRKLGQGSFAKVYRVEKKKKKACTNRYAIKLVSKRKTIEGGGKIDSIFNEIRILRQLRLCDNVVKLHSVYESKSSVQLVLDYAKGGNLYKLKKKMSTLTEEDARNIMK